MRELAMILNRKRVRRGSIDFDLPEPVIEFDERTDEEHYALGAQHRQPHHRRVHAVGQRVRGQLSGEQAASRRSIASTRSPIPSG
jgi:hypothetical protein